MESESNCDTRDQMVRVQEQIAEVWFRYIRFLILILGYRLIISFWMLTSISIPRSTLSSTSILKLGSMKSWGISTHSNQSRAISSPASERKLHPPQEKKGKKRLRNWAKSSPSLSLKRALPLTVALERNIWQKFLRSTTLWANIVHELRWTGSWSMKLDRLLTIPSFPTMSQLQLRSRHSSDRPRLY